MQLLAVVTTTASLEEARKIARALVAEGLAACVQISEIESFYMWKGKLQQDTEYRVMAKTTADNYQAVERGIQGMHSYELPAIYAVPLEPVYEPYAQWVADNSQR